MYDISNKKLSIQPLRCSYKLSHNPLKDLGKSEARLCHLWLNKYFLQKLCALFQQPRKQPYSNLWDMALPDPLCSFLNEALLMRTAWCGCTARRSETRRPRPAEPRQSRVPVRPAAPAAGGNCQEMLIKVTQPRPFQSPTDTNGHGPTAKPRDLWRTTATADADLSHPQHQGTWYGRDDHLRILV